MKKLFAVTIFGLLLLAPVFAMGATFTGSIQGFTCVTQGKICPIGQEDPMAAAENVFVLLVDAAKGEYYFLPGIDKAALVRHINEQIKVNGDLDKKYRSIKVKEIVNSKGKTVWSRAMEDEMQRLLNAE
jgi:hypothetical protein